MRNREQGLTIVELLIVMVVTGMLTGMIFVFTFGYWKQGVYAQTEINAITERLNASDYLRENLSSSTGLATQNSVPDDNVLVSEPTDGTGKYWKIIHAYKGLISNTSGVTPVLYFKRYSIDSSQNIIFNGLLPYEDDYLVYMDAPTKQLRVRVLANKDAPGNATATTCMPATSTCAADRVLANDVTGMDMRYFTKAGLDITYSETTVVDTVPDPDVTYTTYGPDYPVVEVVEMTMKLSKVPPNYQNEVFQTSTIIRVALRNS
jgi:type II secretory pathway pseudopilin PulG